MYYLRHDLLGMSYYLRDPSRITYAGATRMHWLGAWMGLEGVLSEAGHKSLHHSYL
jgi:hypothetical protein